MILPLASQQENHHIRKMADEFAGRLVVFEQEERQWADRVRRYVKAELKREEVSYAELARRLKDQGLEETESSITAKLNRGTFAATFFIAVMTAIEKQYVTIKDI